MIPFSPYNVLIPKFKIDEFVPSGLVGMHEVFAREKISQDEYLFAVAAKNATEVRDVFDRLLTMGFGFDDGAQRSEDFTVASKEGLWWNVPWLITDPEGRSWFIADVEAPVNP